MDTLISRLPNELVLRIWARVGRSILTEYLELIAVKQCSECVGRARTRAGTLCSVHRKLWLLASDESLRTELRITPRELEARLDVFRVADKEPAQARLACDEFLKASLGPFLSKIAVTGVASVTDEHLELISERCPALRDLNISNNSEITNKGFSAISRRCRLLERLAATAFFVPEPKYNDAVFCDLERLENLMEVDFSWGKASISGSGALGFCRASRSIQKIVVKFCSDSAELQTALNAAADKTVRTRNAAGLGVEILL